MVMSRRSFSFMSEGILNVNQNLDDRTPTTHLHAAVLSGQSDVVQILLDKGAMIDKENEISMNGQFKGWTPLHVASTFGKENIVKIRLNGGADINRKTPSGDTPLKLASTAICNCMDSCKCKRDMGKYHSVSW